MNCQVCQCPLDDKLVCPNCGPQQPTAAGGRTLVKARRAKIPTEVVMAVSDDRTGSSEPYAAAIPTVFERTGRGLGERISAVRYDVWSHGDLDEGQDPIQLAQAVDLDQAIAAIKSVTYGNGGDPEESHGDQIENLLNVTAWGADPIRTRNVLLMFATADTKPLRSGRTMAQLGKEIKDRRVFLFLVCQETPNLRELVDSSGGYLIEISVTPDDKEIQQVVARLTATITATAAQGGTIALSAVQPASRNGN